MWNVEPGTLNAESGMRMRCPTGLSALAWALERLRLPSHCCGNATGGSPLSKWEQVASQAPVHGLISCGGASQKLSPLLVVL